MSVHIARTHDIDIAGEIDAVFPMFTPAGEEQWVDDWRPEYLSASGRETAEGMIFRTRHGGEETLWSRIGWDPAQHRVKYVRVTPGVRMGFVEVSCQSSLAGTTKVSVSYHLTSLSPEGDTLLADLTPDHYRTMINAWRPRVEAALSRG